MSALWLAMFTKHCICFPRILVDLLNLNVAPLAVFQMLKSMCAGQRLASDPQDSVFMSLSTSTSETRG